MTAQPITSVWPIRHDVARRQLLEVLVTKAPYRWQGIADALRERITSGDLAVGDLLPSVRTVMETHSVSDNTVSRALAELAAEGLVRAEHGIGVRVIAAGESGKSTDDQLAELRDRVTALEDAERRRTERETAD